MVSGDVRAVRRPVFVVRWWSFWLSLPLDEDDSIMVGFIVQMDNQHDESKSKSSPEASSKRPQRVYLWGLLVVAWAGFEPAAKGL